MSTVIQPDVLVQDSLRSDTPVSLTDVETPSRFRDYLELTKPRIAVMALVTVVVGNIVASGSFGDLIGTIHLVLGTLFLAAGSSVLNQVLERDTDALMRRTQNRPIPSGRIGVTEATLFGVASSIIGMAYLFFQVNVMTGLVGTVTLTLYVFVYTPAKRYTTLNTVIGAIPGALPPVMGWTAATGRLDVGAWVLFLTLFLWQFPHFFAIAWMYREDYARAGLKMLPSLDDTGRMTARQMLGYGLVLVPVSMVPTLLGLAGSMYFVGAFLLGAGMVVSVIGFVYDANNARARSVMRASLVYLPALLILLLIDLH